MSIAATPSCSRRALAPVLELDRISLFLASAVVACVTSAAGADTLERFVFEPSVAFAAGANSTGVDTADLDGDGDLDVVVSNRETDDVSVFANDGTGNLTWLTNVPAGTTPRYVIAADFDNDEMPDLATVSEDNTLRILRNLGAATFETAAVIPVFRPSWLVSLDVDLDDDVDLFVTHLDESVERPGGSPARLSLYVNDGAGTFAFDGSWEIGAFPRGGALGHFNGDAWLDIAITNNISNDVTILHGTGDGFVVAQSLAVGVGPRYAASSDLDGDGDVDLAVVHKNSDRLWILRNDGSGQFTAPFADRYLLGNAPHAVVATDLDGDGDDDLAIAPVGSAWLDLLENDGTASFTQTTTPSLGGSAHLVAADLDGDGHPDLATADSSAGTTTVHVSRSATAGARTVLKVRVDGSPGASGATWDSALDLASALEPARLAALPPPVAIWMAAGTYTPTAPGGEDPRTASFTVSPGVLLAGGFAGVETSLWGRPESAPEHETRLSGDLAGDDGPDGANVSENAYRVVSISGSAVGDATCLDGFVIAAGQADGRTHTDGAGVAMTAISISPLVLRAMCLEDNHALGDGGGLLVDGSVACVLMDCAFNDNTAARGGGLASRDGVELDIRGTTFEANGATSGGGLWHSGGAVVARGCTFTQNDGVDGGGLHVEDGATALLAGGVWTGNTGVRGGAIASTDADVTAMLIVATGNQATDGGAWWMQGGSVLVHGSRVVGNAATARGGAFYTAGTLPTIGQTTIAANTAGLGGGVFVSTQTPAAVEIVNTILWDNTGGAIGLDAGADADVRHSIVTGGWPGDANSASDPKFIDAPAGDYRVTATSPAIDAGDDAAVASDVSDVDEDGDVTEPVPLDLDFEPRFTGASVDLGAYESRFCPGDIDGDGAVAFVDLLTILIFWGPCPGCVADLDANGIVDFADLLTLLSLWGACPGAP